MYTKVKQRTTNGGNLVYDYYIDGEKIPKGRLGKVLTDMLNNELNRLSYTISKCCNELDKAELYHKELREAAKSKFKIYSGDICDALNVERNFVDYWDKFDRDNDLVSKYRRRRYINVNDLELFEVMINHCKDIRKTYEFGVYSPLWRDIDLMSKVNAMYKLGLNNEDFGIREYQDFDLYHYTDDNGRKWYCTSYNGDEIGYVSKGERKTVSINDVVTYDKSNDLVDKLGVQILREGVILG